MASDDKRTEKTHVCGEPFTLHFLDVNITVSIGWIGEGLSQPFTTLHHPSPIFIFRLIVLVDFVADFVNQSIPILQYVIVGTPTRTRWRAVKGGEGLKQPFTQSWCLYSTTYIAKVKGEGFLAKFSCFSHYAVYCTNKTGVPLYPIPYWGYECFTRISPKKRLSLPTVGAWPKCPPNAERLNMDG